MKNMKFAELLEIFLEKQEETDKIEVFYFYSVYEFFKDLTKDSHIDLDLTENLETLEKIWKCLVINIIRNDLVPEKFMRRFYENIGDIETLDFLMEEEHDELSEIYSQEVDLFIEKWRRGL